MRRLLICLISIISLSGSASTKNPCVVMGSSVDIDVRQAMENDLGISEKDLDLGKTELVLLENNPLDKKIAEQMALADSKPPLSLNYKKMLDFYLGYHPRNLIVRYRYFNQEGKENIFIGSSVVNDEECSVYFNGYITVKREF